MLIISISEERGSEEKGDKKKRGKERRGEVRRGGKGRGAEGREGRGRKTEKEGRKLEVTDMSIECDGFRGVYVSLNS